MDNPKDIFNKSQYGIWGVPYHIHNGQDSPRVNVLDLDGWFTFNEVVSIPVSGAGVSQVFTPNAPVNGSVTMFATISHGTSGTAVLWGTTAGTITTIASSGTAGTFVGSSSIVNAKVIKGDTVKVTASGGSMTCLVGFAFTL